MLDEAGNDLEVYKKLDFFRAITIKLNASTYLG